MAQSPRSLNIDLSLLESHREKEWLLADLRKQMAKDLNCPPEEIPQNGLENWLQEWIVNYQNQGRSLLDLFYRVDLDEKYLSANSAAIASALLKREAIKIYFRAQYSGKI